MVGEYSQDFADLKTGFADLKTLLEYQNQYIADLQEQALTNQEANATTQAEQEANYQTTLDALNSIATNTQETTNKLITTNSEVVAMETQIADLQEQQQHMQTTVVEGTWILAVVMAIAVGMKVFWDNTLKW